MRYSKTKNNINSNSISQNIVWVMINCLYALVLYSIKPAFANVVKEKQIIIVFWIGISTVVLSIIMIKLTKKEFDFYAILIVITFVFMFGQHFLYWLNIYPKDMIILTDRVHSEALYDTGFLVCFSIIAMNIGYLLINPPKTVRDSLYQKSFDDERCRFCLYKAGKVFFFISLVPTLIELVTNIYLTFTVGYAERLTNSEYKRSGITNITGIISGFMIPAIIALFISRKPKQKWPVIVLVGYTILYTLSGSRINTMILLVSTLYIQNKFFTKLNKKRIALYLVAAIIVMFAFSVVSSARKNIGIGKDNFSMIQSSIDEIAENNPIVSALSEAGYTFEATSAVIDNCPNNKPYNKGLSYISGLLYIIPNGFTGDFYNSIASSTDDTFKGYINAYGSGIGSSFIAEAYWNFGYVSLLLMIVFGCFIGKICSKIDVAIKTKDYSIIYICLYVLITITFYVRSDTRTFYRNFIWFGLPVLLLYRNYYKEYSLNENGK